MSDLLKLAAAQRPARHTRSRMDPYLADMRRLQAEGYSLEQLRAFLAQVGVKVARQTIQEFLSRRETQGF